MLRTTTLYQGNVRRALRGALVAAAVLLAGVCQALPPAPGLATPLALDDLDPSALSEWVDGAERAVKLADGPRHVIWTQTSAPEWDGLQYADSRTAGVRHLRIGWRAGLEVGTVLVRGGGQVSVLKASAAYPGDLGDESHWLPATRLNGRDVVGDEAGREDYCLWTLPPGTRTRAIRFSHTAAPTDRVYGGWLGGAYLLGSRLANVAPQAVAAASANEEAAGRINNGSNDGTWGAWENAPEGGPVVIGAQNAPWVLLTWPSPVRLRGLCALWAGFGAAQVQTCTRGHLRSTHGRRRRLTGRWSGPRRGWRTSIPGRLGPTGWTSGRRSPLGRCGCG